MTLCDAGMRARTNDNQGSQARRNRSAARDPEIGEVRVGSSMKVRQCFPSSLHVLCMGDA